MASGQTKHASKPSFATVAASAYVPPNHAPNVCIAKSPPQNQEPSAVAHTSPSSNSAHHEETAGTRNGIATKAERTFSNETPSSISGAAGNSPADAPESRLAGTSVDHQPENGLAKPTADDSNTQTSSNGSGKPASVDGKSVESGSGTTFALDEKESLRPDDSASARAVDEEDMFSAPGSVATGSRVGSDSGARAFRDQLREIQIMGSTSQRLGIPARMPSSGVPSPSGNVGVTGPSNDTRVLPTAGPVPDISVPEKVQELPDEKLMSALESPRDRLFVLKLEQDIIDFIKDSKESSIDLPQCNAFYRMLAHRLADYYQIGHYVDTFTTQSSVRLYKTESCHLPFPLSGFPSRSASNTPPPSIPARKIMRRGEENKGASGTNTGANSDNPSKCTSEAGGDSGSELGQNNSTDQKSKQALTREEREVKYREARERIFGQVEENETCEAPNISEDKDVSRSSSAAGKKKGKKTRTNNDDGFEARSQFVPHYHAQYPVSSYGGDNGFYPAYGGMVPGPYVGANPGMPPTYAGYAPTMQPDLEPPVDFQWQQSMSGNGMSVQGYQPPSGFDFAAEFQRGMESFQSAQGMMSQAGPKLSPSIGAFPDVYGHQPRGSQQPWSPPPYPPYHMSMPAQNPGFPGAHNPYPYGQMLRSPFQSGRPNGHQHPLPGSFNRAQFNPQSQSFVPGQQMGVNQMPMAMGQTRSPHMNIVQPSQVPQINQNRATPPVQQITLNSPRLSHNLPAPPRNASGGHPPPPKPGTPTPPQMRSTSAPTSGSVPAQSTIAKWGTPSHLPPKPPPPASMQPQRMPDSHRPIPPPQVYSAPPRRPDNPSLPQNLTQNGVGGALAGPGSGGGTRGT